jgi:beta-glucosidase
MLIPQHKAFSYYDVTRKAWVADKGSYEFRVGPSSTVVALSRNFLLEKAFKWIGQQEPTPL